jgi:tetratricopeptide (TPR) repeat protein
MIRTPLAALATLALAACGPAHRASAPAAAALTPATAAPAARASPEAEAALASGREAFLGSRWAEAEERLGAAARLAPADPRPHLALAELHTARRNLPAAAEEAARASAVADSAEARVLRGRALALLRRFDAAVADLDRAVALAPRQPLAYAVLTTVHLNRGDLLAAERVHAAAVGAFGRAAAADALSTQLHAIAPDPVAPEEALDRCTRGWAAMLDGDWEYARNEMLVGLRYAPRFVWCSAGLGEAMWRAGDPVRGEQVLRAAIAEYRPHQASLRADASGTLAALVLARGRAAEAVDLARGALAVRGDRAGLLDVLARACDAGGDAACARDATERLLRIPGVAHELREVAERRLKGEPLSAER